MTIEVDTITGPAFLACALINGDTSGLDETDLRVLQAFETMIAPWRVVDATDDEPRFTWSFELYGGNTAGGDVVDYIVHKVTMP